MPGYNNKTHRPFVSTSVYKTINIENLRELPIQKLVELRNILIDEFKQSKGRGLINWVPSNYRRWLEENGFGSAVFYHTDSFMNKLNDYLLDRIEASGYDTAVPAYIPYSTKDDYISNGSTTSTNTFSSDSTNVAAEPVGPTRPNPVFYNSTSPASRTPASSVPAAPDVSASRPRTNRSFTPPAFPASNAATTPTPAIDYDLHPYGRVTNTLLGVHRNTTSPQLSIPEVPKLADAVREGKALDFTKIPISRNKNSNTLGKVIDGIGNMLPHIGDALGMYGTIKGMQDAEALTREHFGQVKPNENFYANYGQKSLNEYDNINQYIEAQALKQKEDILKQQAVYNANIDQNTRSTNVANVMKQANHSNTVNSMANSNNQINQMRMNLAQLKANLLSQIDQMRMQGAAQADLANRQDLANYYSNLSQNKMDYAKGLQHLGSMVNQQKLARVNSKLVNSLSQYGFEINPHTGEIRKKK